MRGPTRTSELTQLRRWPGQLERVGTPDITELHARIDTSVSRCAASRGETGLATSGRRARRCRDAPRSPGSGPPCQRSGATRAAGFTADCESVGTYAGGARHRQSDFGGSPTAGRRLGAGDEGSRWVPGRPDAFWVLDVFDVSRTRHATAQTTGQPLRVPGGAGGEGGKRPGTRSRSPAAVSRGVAEAFENPSPTGSTLIEGGPPPAVHRDVRPGRAARRTVAANRVLPTGD